MYLWLVLCLHTAHACVCDDPNDESPNAADAADAADADDPNHADNDPDDADVSVETHAVVSCLWCAYDLCLGGSQFTSELFTGFFVYRDEFLLLPAYLTYLSCAEAEAETQGSLGCQVWVGIL